MTIRVFAPAKINLTLKVGRPRPDGLHPLESVVMFADVGDVVEAAPGEGLSLSISGEFASDLAADDSNLVLRAARALAAAAGMTDPGASLALEKNLPVASGIGGGSSDAAAALRALNQLWGLGLSQEQLIEIARPLGADVPVCVNARSSFMTGTGERFQPIDAPALWAVLVNPIIPLPTANVYRQFDRMDLGGEMSGAVPPVWADAASVLRDISLLGNDLEIAARALLPELDDIAETIRTDPRVLYTALSGSGATMFAILPDTASASALAEHLLKTRPYWWTRATQLG